MPVNVLTKNGYTGINIVSLWVAAQLKGFSSPVWATYKQWSELGAQVRAGVKSSPVIFYKEFDAEPDPDVADDDGKPRVARASRVFNAAQVEGYALNPVPETLGPVARIAGADAFVRATGARIEHGGDRAFYRLSTDSIQMPPEEMFCGTETLSRSEGYYATLVHELTRRETQARSHVRQTLRRSGLRRRGIGR
ncbi:antirestriction protein ArdC [Bradyrhizobium sp. GM2.2]